MACCTLHAAAAALVVSATACRPSAPGEADAPAAPAPDPPVTYADVTTQAGIDFRHVSGMGPDRHVVNTLGAGACWIDADGDGLLDLFLVQSGPRPGYDGPPPQPAQLYRNEGDGTFTDATAGSGVELHLYGMGCVSADYDNDGRPDLYVSGHGRDQLFHGEGGGRFRDVSEEAGVGDPRASTSAAFGDLDGDGLLDLFVANYAPVGTPRDPRCTASTGKPAVCHPSLYEGERDVLYRNRGDGTFEDVTERALPATSTEPRFSEKGLGVVMADYDEDGDQDVFVANDSCPNVLWRNLGGWRFEDAALAAGVAFDLNGRALANMGCDWGDHDGDGHLDLFVTHFELEANTLYRSLGDGTFRDVTFETGMGVPSLPFLAFGARFTDHDHDGDLDVLVANGHVDPEIGEQAPGRSYRQPMQLFDNLGGTRGFADATASAGAALSVARVGRAVAIADYDEDGDDDALVTAVDDKAMLLRNDGGSARSWVAFQLQGTRGNRDGIGARIEIVAGGRRQVAEVTCGGSYLSGHELRRRFGLADASVVDSVRVRWPSGTVQELAGLPARTVHRVVEP